MLPITTPTTFDSLLVCEGPEGVKNMEDIAKVLLLLLYTIEGTGYEEESTSFPILEMK